MIIGLILGFTLAGIVFGWMVRKDMDHGLPSIDRNIEEFERGESS